MADYKPAAATKLTIDLNAITQNWKRLNSISGKAGAAIKANAYGLGTKQVAKALYDTGCRDFFVVNWNEADELRDTIPNQHIAVLNGVSSDDIEYAAQNDFIPVLNSPTQVKLWRDHSAGKACHIMLDSGINRLGIDNIQCVASLFDGLNVDIAMSHLASADEDSPQNEAQREIYNAMVENIMYKRKSLANSAGIMLGKDYHYDLTRPGLSLYGGIARSDMHDVIAPVISISARILQVRTAIKGSLIGYNGTYECQQDMTVATAAIGYADGYLRSFSNKGMAYHGGNALPLIGRVSMDLITLDAQNAPDLREGDWIKLNYDLVSASKETSLSQYELLTVLGARFDKHYI